MIRFRQFRDVLDSTRVVYRGRLIAVLARLLLSSACFLRRKSLTHIDSIGANWVQLASMFWIFWRTSSRSLWGRRLKRDRIGAYGERRLCARLRSWIRVLIESRRRAFLRTIEPDEIFWYGREQGALVQRPVDEDGLYRSSVFPGLWLDPAALLNGDTRQLRAVVNMGCATPEHSAFLALLVSRGFPC
jgi:hypothetical protein